MQLKYIELQGFKSFPDKTVISFGRGITAIVGPNGSGKSNIADAVRWVMGETSSKSLRGQKMEDVIFDGTSLRKPLGFAEVTLVLDNSDRTLDLAYDEVAITRRYYRSGESEYFINRSDVRLRDIQELLRDTGLGKSGYSIIGQGAITEIIAAKSADRRALFEEAAGIAGFKFKKDESLRRLRQTQDNLVRLTDILAELQSRLEPLENQARKAKKYLALRDEKKELEITLWVNRLAVLAENTEKTKALITTFSADLQTTVAQLEKSEQDITAALARTEQLTMQIESLRADSAKQSERIADKQTQILVAKNDIDHAHQDIARLQATITDAQSEKEKSAAEMVQLQAQLSQLQTTYASFDEQMASLAADEAAAESALQALQQEISAAEKELDDLGQEETLLRVRLSSVTQNQQNQLKYIEERQTEISDAAERLCSLTVLKAELEQKSADISERLQSDKNVRGGYEVKRHALQRDYDTNASALTENRTEYDRKQSRLHILQGMEKHYEGFQNSVKRVMDESKRGTLQGIEGTVSDILEVDGAYTTAVETALGGALQNIVTDTEQNSKNGIYFLKNRSAGRATFLPVSNIRGRRLEQSFSSEPGFVGLAADLVKADARYAGIVDFLLGRTVVCSDMDAAAALARKNKHSFRVVTLDGQVVNVGGSLTGGSAARGFGILSRHNEIEDLKKDCDGIRRKISQLESSSEEYKREIAQIDAHISGQDAQIRITEDEQIRVCSDLQHCMDSLQTISAQEKTLQAELQELTQQKVSDEQIHCQLEQKLQENLSANEAQQRLLASLKEQLAQLDEQSAQIAQQQHTCQLEKLNVEKDIENARFYLESLLLRQKQQEQSADKLLSEIEAYREKISALQTAIEVLEQEKRDMETVTKDSGEQILRLVADRTAVEQTVQRLRDSEKGLYDRKEKLSRELERQENANSAAQEESDGIISKIWDEYELTLSEAQGQCVPIDNYAEAQKKVNSVKAAMRALGEVNLTAVDEYVQVKERYDTMSAQVKDLTDAKSSIEKIIDDLTAQMTSVFAQQFKVINIEFEKIFRQLFNGGTAKLTLDDPENILESGIEIYVAPPGKIIKHLSSLSGGEQSLTAIALYFAILTIRPAPFCLLDEIEAALDDVNVVRYAEYLRRHEKTQFIVITHRRGTMEAADRLYGVTMREKGISRILAIDVSEIEKHM